jgi:hypothetical protein
MSAKRDKVIALLKKVFEPLEGKDGPNFKRYMNKIKTEEGLNKFYKDIKSGKDNVNIIMPNMKSSARMNDIVQVAKSIDVPISTHLYLTDQITGKKYKTNHKYVVIKTPVRRVKQFVDDKISLPEGDNKIDLLSGQVVKPDKGSSISLIEAQVIKGKGLDKSLYELLKIRGGDINAYSEFTSRILETGATEVENIGQDSVPRSSVVASTYLKAAHLDNNLVKGSNINE